MKKYATFLLFFIFFISCGYSSKGKIVKRGSCNKTILQWIGSSDSKNQFLVNTSQTEIITFTLNETVTSRLKAYSWSETEFKVTSETSTVRYKLYPGEEKELVCEKITLPNNSEMWHKYEYAVVGEVIEK